MNKVLILASFLLTTVLAAKPLTLDRIVAIVNTDIIMLSELQAASQHYQDKKDQLPRGKTYQRRVLDQLILNKIKDNFLSRNKAGVSSTMVDSAIAQIAQNNNLTIDGLAEELPKQGLSIDDLRKKISQDIERAQLQQLLLPSKAIINRTALQQRIAKLPKSVVLGNSPKFYHVGHILITGEGRKNEAYTVAKKLRQGANFSRMAKKVSEAPTAENGGDLGWRQRAEFPGLIATRLHNANAGQVKGPFWAAGGWHIVKVLETHGGKIERVFSKEELEQRATDALIQIKVNKYLNRLLQKLKQETYIEVRL